jgi:hypothetical protein
MSSSNKDIAVEKAETVGHKKYPIRREQGQPAIVTSSQLIQDSARKELRPENRYDTINTMCTDAAIFTSIDFTNLLVGIALNGGQYVPKKNNEKSRIASYFLNYSIRNISNGTWLDFVNNITTDLKYGFSLTNLVLEKKTKGKYKGNYCIKSLSPRSQGNVYGWVWDEDLRYLQGVVFKPNLKKDRLKQLGGFNGQILLSSISTYQDGNYVYIPIENLIHTKHNGTLSNPQGNPPAIAAYQAWYEKRLVEILEISGATKDLAGILILRVHPDLLEKAAQPDLYPEAAKELAALQDDANKLHQGKSTYLLLSSESDDISKKYHYDVTLQGVEGGGKQYSTKEIIEQKKTAIYNVFGTAHLLLGQDNVGSNSLAEAQTSSHNYHVLRSIQEKVEVINTSLTTKLLSANKIELDWEDMPDFVPASHITPSADEISKVVQRMKSVGALTPSALTELYESMGWAIEGIEDLTFDDGDTSRGSDGFATAGDGTSTEVASNDTSVSNNENGGVDKSLSNRRACKTTDRIFNTITGEVINADDLNKEGYYK